VIFTTFNALADDSIRIYSALGDPIVVEIELNSEEQELDSFLIVDEDGNRERFSAEFIESRERLLILSDQSIARPILSFTLEGSSSAAKNAHSSRNITIFLNPVADHSSRALWIELIRAHDNTLNKLITQQAKKQPLTPLPETELSPLQNWYAALSGWIGFLLLGAALALYIIYWWRSAEVVSLAELDGDEDYKQSGTDLWQEFQQGVDNIEATIEHSTDSSDKV